MLEKYRSRRASQVFWAVVATAILGGLVNVSDFSKMMDALKRVQFIYVFIATGFGILAYLIWSVNWHNFFEISDIDAKLPRTFQLFTASRFLNLVTPLGQFGGQPVMAYLVAKESDANYEKALATLSSADLIVILPITIYIFLGFLYLKFAGGIVPPEVRSATGIAFGLACFGVFMGYMGWRRPKILKDILFKIFSQVKWLTGKDSDLVKKINQFLTNLEDSYRHIGKNPKLIYKSFVLVFLAYIFKVMAFYSVTASINMELNFFHALLLIPLVSIANFSPTPGGTGAVEAALAGLTVVVVSSSLATAVVAAALYRIATYWMGVLLGYTSMATISFNADEYADFMEKRKEEQG